MQVGFTLRGSGVDIGGTDDAFQYVYQIANGDCSIIDKVESIARAIPKIIHF